MIFLNVVQEAAFTYDFYFFVGQRKLHLKIRIILFSDHTIGNVHKKLISVLDPVCVTFDQQHSVIDGIAVEDAPKGLGQNSSDTGLFYDDGCDLAAGTAAEVFSATIKSSF